MRWILIEGRPPELLHRLQQARRGTSEFVNRRLRMLRKLTTALSAAYDGHVEHLVLRGLRKHANLSSEWRTSRWQYANEY